MSSCDFSIKKVTVAVDICNAIAIYVWIQTMEWNPKQSFQKSSVLTHFCFVIYTFWLFEEQFTLAPDESKTFLKVKHFSQISALDYISKNHARNCFKFHALLYVIYTKEIITRKCLLVLVFIFVWKNMVGGAAVAL